MRLARRDVLCQCVGAAGSVVSCAGMIISLTAGLLGATGSTLAQGSGMAGMGSAGSPSPAQAGTHPLLIFLNHIAVPLLLASILLMLVGVARAGWRARGLVAAGAALLLGTMFSIPPVAAAWLLGGGYALILIGYAVAWRAARRRFQTEM